MGNVLYDKILGRVREATKVNVATAGDFVGVDSSGNLIDSGCNPSSFPNKIFASALYNLTQNQLTYLRVGDVVVITTDQSHQTGLSYIVTSKSATDIEMITKGGQFQFVHFYKSNQVWLYTYKFYDLDNLQEKTPIAPIVGNSTQYYAWENGNTVYYTDTNAEGDLPFIYYYDNGVLTELYPSENETFTISQDKLVIDDGNGTVTPYSASLADGFTDVRIAVNIFYTPFVVSSQIVNFHLVAPLDNTVLNIYSWKFTTGATAPTVNWPAVSWNGGTPPTIEANTIYEINIADGIACWASTPVNN